MYYEYINTHILYIFLKYFHVYIYIHIIYIVYKYLKCINLTCFFLKYVHACVYIYLFIYIYIYIYTGAGHIIKIKKLIYFTNSIQKVKLV